MRLDRFRGISGPVSHIQHTKGQVRLDGKRADEGADRVADRAHSAAAGRASCAAMRPPISAIAPFRDHAYEDDGDNVINKPAGLACRVVPQHAPCGCTLARCSQAATRSGCVSSIADNDTGCLLIAKTLAAVALSKTFRSARAQGLLGAGVWCAQAAAGLVSNFSPRSRTRKSVMQLCAI